MTQLVKRVRCCAVGVCCLPLALVFGWAASARAQALRDPTLPPVVPGLIDAAKEQPNALIQSGSVLVSKRQGAYYVMFNTRWYAQGQQLGQARIERITETEIWLREAGTVQKIQVFGGVQRRTAEPLPPLLTPAAVPLVVRPAQTEP